MQTLRKSQIRRDEKRDLFCFQIIMRRFTGYTAHYLMQWNPSMYYSNYICNIFILPHHISVFDMVYRTNTILINPCIFYY